MCELSDESLKGLIDKCLLSDKSLRFYVDAINQMRA